MVNTAGVKIKGSQEIIYFLSNDLELKRGDKVIIETPFGNDFGTVSISKRIINEKEWNRKLNKIIRIATKEDEKQEKINEEKDKRAFETGKRKIKEHNMRMKLIDARYSFDGSKLVFYFTADGRIDFRDLVRDLANIFKIRIELRQISKVEQVKRIGGLGVCGRELCCCSFLDRAEQATIKMAKLQNLTLNTTKVTGPCGRIKCCIAYENKVYEEKAKYLPHIGAVVKNSENQEGKVSQVDVLPGIIKVEFSDEDGNKFYKRYNADEIKIVKDSTQDDYSETDEMSKDEQKQDLEELQKIEKDDESNNS